MDRTHRAPGVMYPPADGDGERSWRRLIFPAVFLVTLAQTLGGVGKHSDGAGFVVGCAVLLGFCVTYVVALVSLGSRSLHRFWACYSGLCGLFVVETFFAHGDASTMLIFIGTLAIAVLWTRAVPIVVVLIAVTFFLPAAVPSWHHGVDAGAATSLSIVLAAMFAFFRLVHVNHELSEAKAEIAALAAEGERQRIARDLHDLLGHSLTTITLKSGLARRLFEQGEVDRAANEISEVEALSRQSLADVRAAVAGYRTTTLTGELATGRELLRTLGVHAEFPPSADPVDAANQELFGWVVREGLTNVVRHAHATRCSIAIGTDWIAITDDGAGPV
ncbi:MAG: two-component system histidine kinase, partial [Ilumatobacteraceae bacterium]|nr:two-component system histidine kinase [Ilumatobacteraceae bacterium]